MNIVLFPLIRVYYIQRNKYKKRQWEALSPKVSEVSFFFWDVDINSWNLQRAGAVRVLGNDNGFGEQAARFSVVLLDNLYEFCVQLRSVPSGQDVGTIITLRKSWHWLRALHSCAQLTADCAVTRWIRIRFMRSKLKQLLLCTNLKNMASYLLFDESPTASVYYNLRKDAGLTPPPGTEATLTGALALSVYTVLARTEGGTVVGMGRIIGDGAVFLQVRATESQTMYLSSIDILTACGDR